MPPRKTTNALLLASPSLTCKFKVTFDLQTNGVTESETVMAVPVKKNVCLIVIDGWGISDETNGERAVIPSTK